MRIFGLESSSTAAVHGRVNNLKRHVIRNRGESLFDLGVKLYVVDNGRMMGKGSSGFEFLSIGCEILNIPVEISIVRDNAKVSSRTIV